MKLQSVLLCLKFIVYPKQIMLFSFAVGSLFFPLWTEKYCNALRPQHLGKVIQIRCVISGRAFSGQKKDRLGRYVIVLPSGIKSIFLSIN